MRVAAPVAVAQAIADHRIGNQFETRQRAAQFNERAWHVVIRGDDDQARTDRIRIDPAAGLVGIAGGVQRGTAEIDTAVEKLLEVRHEARHLVPRRLLIDTRDEQPPGPALGEELDRVHDPFGSARQSDDALGR